MLLIKILILKENELTLQSSRLKLIISASSGYYAMNGPAVLSALLPHSHSPGVSHSNKTNLSKFSSHGPLAAIGSSMSNISINSVQSNSSNRSNASTTTLNSYYSSVVNGSGGVTFSNSNETPPRANQSIISSSPSSNSHSEHYVFLFTSDFERNAWVEEINSAIYACKLKFYL